MAPVTMLGEDEDDEDDEMLDELQVMDPAHRRRIKDAAAELHARSLDH